MHDRMHSRAWLVLVPALVVACGARTSLRIEDEAPTTSVENPEQDAGTTLPDASPDAPTDAPADALKDALADAPTDAPKDAPADAPKDAPVDVGIDMGCKSDAVCDDGVPCTLDACDLASGACTHVPRDALCDDGLFCTGVEACDPIQGCVTTPLACADAVACTVDTCDEAKKACLHEPEDALCPVSHKCSAVDGCYALAYAHSQDALYEILLPSGKVQLIGPMGQQITDIALVSNKQLYGLSFSEFFQLDTTTGEAVFQGSISAPGAVAFDVAPDGQLYVGGDALYRLDLDSGQLSFVAPFPPGLQASGDLAVLGGRTLVTARSVGGGGGVDLLVEFDLASQSAKVLGETGFDCIWGLAAFGETLYGLTCNGEVLSVDPKTGKSAVLSQGGPAFWGASAR